MSFRALTGLALAGSLFATAALAGDAAPLAPGKPAGVQQAQIYGTTLFYLSIGAAAIAGLVLASDGNSTTTTTGTGH